MTLYCSFLIVNPRHRSLLTSLSKLADWTVSFLPDPSHRFWFHEHGITTISHPKALGSQIGGGIPGQLLVVDAADEAVANNIVQLICAAYNIVEGNPGDRVDLRSVFPLPKDETERESIYENLFRTHGFFEQFISPLELPIAVAAASKASSDRSLTYAIHKLSRSFATDSITWWSAHPRYRQIFEKHSPLHAAHVGTSIAINLAFSAIEELQLQVKSSASKKRWLDSRAGQWNPAVLEDIRFRLGAAHIDPDSTVTWIVRGDSSIAETEIAPKLGIPTPYSDGQIVRDVELTLPDALHVCSFIRNYMTAHRFGEASPFLGPYEVHNVQSLARQLILCTCDLWRVSNADLLNRAHK